MQRRPALTQIVIGDPWCNCDGECHAENTNGSDDRLRTATKLHEEESGKNESENDEEYAKQREQCLCGISTDATRYGDEEPKC